MPRLTGAAARGPRSRFSDHLILWEHYFETSDLISIGIRENKDPYPVTKKNLDCFDRRKKGSGRLNGAVCLKHTQDIVFMMVREDLVSSAVRLSPKQMLDSQLIIL